MELITSRNHAAPALDPLFARPQKYRDNILRGFHFDQQGWDGQAYVVVYPTKFCPVGCAHCYFASPKPARKTHETSLSGADAGIISRVLDEATTAFLQITGAGEPLLELQTVLNLIRRSHARRIDIHTSAVTLNSVPKAEEILEELFAAFELSGNDGRLTFRVSIDEFHLARIGDRVTANAITAFRRHYTRYAQGRFYLKLHSLIGDESIPGLLSGLQSEIRLLEYQTENEYGKAFAGPLPVKATFHDGTLMEMDYSLRMLADARPDMSRAEEIEKAVAAYDRLRIAIPGLYRDPDGRKGLCFIIHEDGSMELWNTTPSDNMPNVRRHSFAQVRQSVFSDVIQVATLEKGTPYIESLLDEVNPRAIRRAKAIGSAVHFHFNAFTEAKDRLYVSIRVIQDFLADGRLDVAAIRALDPVVQTAVVLSRWQLKALYQASDHNIVDEYLEDPRVTAQKLVQLYRLFELGHYEATPDAMIEKVRASATLPKGAKTQFLAGVG